jgi:hypothetical protein
MDRRFRRKIWRLEKQMSEVKTRKKEEWNDFFLTLPARDHVAKVAAIVLEGEPKIDEPLLRARQRAWQRFGLSTDFQEFDPWEVGYTLYIKLTNGKDEIETFSSIFDQAPLWLLHFTTIALDAFLLKFKLPDLSAPTKWGREGIKDARRWPELPLGIMTAGESVAEQIVLELRRFSADDCNFISQLRRKPEKEWSHAESDRHNEIWSRLHKPKGR